VDPKGLCRLGPVAIIPSAGLLIAENAWFGTQSRADWAASLRPALAFLLWIRVLS
jgi:hypothetical protein